MTNYTINTNAVEAIVSIQATIDNIGDTWLANDGGLTWAAVDAQGTGRSLIAYIREGNYSAVWECIDTQGVRNITGDEASMIQDACAWAEPLVWEAWRKEVKGLPEETPFELLKRRIEEGMTMALYKIACPPDRYDVPQWRRDIAIARKA